MMAEGGYCPRDGRDGIELAGGVVLEGRRSRYFLLLFVLPFMAGDADEVILLIVVAA
eukprot:CAMPEP_0181136808 /NCGR_PEP_ID=MMETSP1071-20121207/33368_1 /TAXON_ID=35127 /ORGANISM="Thalassiosira sp., Strain NH16" /LENGTH=56 /DNA_ID=CAMNT_0023223517 /DNA_START=491 /DNA_END=661 /DNA_ORIENTATION=-